MEERAYFLLIVIVLITFIPLVPRIIDVRMKILRVMKFKMAADFHGKHFHRLVIIVRTVMALVVIYLLALVFFL